MRAVSIPAFLLIAVSGWLFDAPRATAGEWRLSGPYSHENLTVFLVHADGATGDDAAVLTLDEALAAKRAVVHETGDVNELAVENLSPDKWIYVQSGEIVKGGKQDRVLSVDLVLPPTSGQVPIAVFCVEQGRWSGRGEEASTQFESAGKMAASKDLKLAAKAARSQPDVWNQVAKAQEKLSAVLGQSVAAAASPSSFQLTLENERLAAAADAYFKALAPAIDGHADAVGYVFAINGKINSADIYGQTALFRKLWPRLIEASATEAVAEQPEESSAGTVSVADVEAFLAAAESGAATAQDLPAGVRLTTREADAAMLFETRVASSDSDDAWIHRNYIAK
jgi:hypothetical protein